MRSPLLPSSGLLAHTDRFCVGAPGRGGEDSGAHLVHGDPGLDPEGAVGHEDAARGGGCSSREVDTGLVPEPAEPTPLVSPGAFRRLASAFTLGIGHELLLCGGDVLCRRLPVPQGAVAVSGDGHAVVRPPRHLRLSGAADSKQNTPKHPLTSENRGLFKEVSLRRYGFI